MPPHPPPPFPAVSHPLGGIPLVRLDDRAVNARLETAVSVRGIQPFHDFSEGPDWWNTDEYLLHLDQLAKLKMNFIGLHTYPLAEPTVWTG